jgi:hypothetical protein
MINFFEKTGCSLNTKTPIFLPILGEKMAFSSQKPML